MLNLRLVLAWTLLIGADSGQPMTAMTIARGEPQFILGLSWMALMLEGFNGVQIASDRKKEDRYKTGG
jgi:hypothetical protein